MSVTVSYAPSNAPIGANEGSKQIHPLLNTTSPGSRGHLRKLKMADDVLLWSIKRGMRWHMPSH